MFLVSNVLVLIVLVGFPSTQDILTMNYPRREPAMPQQVDNKNLHSRGTEAMTVVLLIGLMIADVMIAIAVLPMENQDLTALMEVETQNMLRLQEATIITETLTDTQTVLAIILTDKDVILVMNDHVGLRENHNLMNHENHHANQHQQHPHKQHLKTTESTVWEIVLTNHFIVYLEETKNK